MFENGSPLLRHFLQTASPKALRTRLTTAAAEMGDAAFAGRVAREIVDRTQPHLAVPEVHGHYRAVVRDGMVFFLSCVSRSRLIDLVVNQLQLPLGTEPHERLVELAKRFPTLHKLGQVIARNPHLDPRVKKWLVHLENGCYGTPAEGILDGIESRLENAGQRARVEVKPDILAEASVGAVFRFRWRPPSTESPVMGVFKVLKPAVREMLAEELDILERTAGFFEANRSRYSLKDFRFLEVFQDVREMLVREIDLAAEQAYLWEAAQFYGGMDGIRIPELLSLSTDGMTAMAYLEGPKITDADLSVEQRRWCASRLFEALVCRPLFSTGESSLFHGDPHAGNILALVEPGSGRLEIGLLDWSLAGRLRKRDRVKTAQLIQAVFKRDLSGIRRSVTALAAGRSMDSPEQRRQFRHIVLTMMRSDDYDRLTIIERTFKLLETLSMEGFLFSPDLMLFRKAIFTLEGVLHDLWPPFDMDEAVAAYISTLMGQELPKRIAYLFFPLLDKPENYPSLISNFELHSLVIHQCFAAIRSGTEVLADQLTAWPAMMGTGPAPAPGKDRLGVDRNPDCTTYHSPSA